MNSISIQKNGYLNGSFWRFVIRRQKIIFVAVVLIVLQFILFKCFYPQAMLIPDSAYYVHAAVQNLNINIWPTGYSRFLQGIHIFVRSDLGVVAFQYFFLEATLIYFYFTILYFFRPGNLISWIILLAIIINPLIVRLCNYILSDSIFASLTILWITIMLWHIFKPRVIHVYIMVILLPILFMLRYYAIFYPLVTVPFVLLSSVSWKVKATSLGIGCLLFIGYIWYNSIQYGKLLGYRQFSPFSGWQIAGNALIMYRSLGDYSKDDPPDSLRELHRFVAGELDSMHKLKVMPDSPLSIYYMWIESSPLKKYVKLRYKHDLLTSEFKKWASMGNLYRDYGTYLIKQHPTAFLKYFIANGIEWYLIPPIELNDRASYWINDEVKEWFGYRSSYMTCKYLNVYSMNSFPIILLLLNGMMTMGVTGFFVFRLYKGIDPAVTKGVILVASFYCVNFIFIVLTAPMVTRYGLSMMVLNIAFGLILLEYIYKADH